MKSDMKRKRTIELFSAGCGCCEEALALLRGIACPSCEISVLDMKDPAVAKRAGQLGVKTVPAILVDGKLVSCCENRGPAEAALRAAGVGQPL